jgi:spore germination protein YaaH
VVLDFESIPAANRAAYTNFVTGLAKSLHAEGKRLEVVVPPDTGSANEPWNNAYDQAKIGAAADAVVVMAYDYSYVGGKPGPIAPLPWVQQVLAYTISRVPVNKVLLGVDTYGYDWTGNQTSAVSLTSVDSFLASRHIQPQWDANAQAPWYTWTDSNGAVHTVYYENARSTQAKLALANLYGIEGVAVWRAGLEDNAVLGVLATYAKGTVK